MNIQELVIWWVDPRAALDYRADELSPEDARRAAAVRSPKALRDWKASRALLQAVRAAVPAPRAASLSHSHGHAICVTAPDGWRVGADLERIKPREVERLAEWVCSPAERNALAGLAGGARLDHFYMLWTLKEAFIKAAGLDFPADMAAVGLAPSDGGLRLCAPAGTWGACSYRLGDDWMASVVWQQPAVRAPDPVRPDWRAAMGCQLPRLAVLGQW